MTRILVPSQYALHLNVWFVNEDRCLDIVRAKQNCTSISLPGFPNLTIVDHFTTKTSFGERYSGYKINGLTAHHPPYIRLVVKPPAKYPESTTGRNAFSEDLVSVVNRDNTNLLYLEPRHGGPVLDLRYWSSLTNIQDTLPYKTLHELLQTCDYQCVCGEIACKLCELPDLGLV